MPFEFLIGMRYLRARRRERFVSLIAILSLIGVAIGTFALTVTLSVMSGFQQELRNRLLAFNPHITVEKTHGGLQDPKALEKKIAAIGGVVAISPFVTSQVMAVSSNSSGVPAYVSGGILRGVVARNNRVLDELQTTLVSGSLSNLDTLYDVTVLDNGHKRVVKLPGTIIGKSLALQLGVRPGDILTLVSPSSLGSAGIGPPRLKRFVVSGIFQSGMYQYDSTLIFVSLKQGRALLADEPELESGIHVRIADIFAAPQIARKIKDLANHGLEVTDWTQTDAPLFSALKIEKFTYFVVLMLIVLVAAFNIVATLVMVVMERRKEIAILQAMGARARSIASIFICEGAVLGIGGTIIGVGLGFVASFLIGRYHLIHLPPDEFMVSWVPVKLYAANFIAIAIAAVVLTLAAAVYPAFRASSLSPVEVIRYE
ncbi:MAG: FtsX-like permease family protein [Candidatus Binataceae bacterium]